MYLGYGEISFSERLCYNLLRGEKMKIKTEQDLSCNEIEVIIKYPQKDKQVNRIIDFLQSFDMQNLWCCLYWGNIRPCNFISNSLHTVIETGADELMIIRITLSNILSLLFVLLSLNKKICILI